MQSDIRFAEERDIPDLCKLWQSCFSDSMDYIRYFYRENFGRISIPILTLNGKPVSMIHLMDASFTEKNDSYPVRFVYAVGTHPSGRGKGYMRSLLQFIGQAANEGGYGLFLKPSPNLKSYYATLGYKQDSRLCLLTILPKSEGKKVSFDPLSAGEYNALRNRAFADRAFVQWPDAHVRWCVNENNFCRGRTFSVSLNGMTHFVMGYPVDGVFQITETDLDPGQLSRVAHPICQWTGTRLLKVLLPEGSCESTEKIVSSVVFNAPLRRTYANLLLF